MVEICGNMIRDDPGDIDQPQKTNNLNGCAGQKITATAASVEGIACLRLEALDRVTNGC